MPSKHSMTAWLAGLLILAVSLGAQAAPAEANAAAQGEPASYAALADLLENDKTRQALIDELRELSSDEANEVDAAEPLAKPDQDAAPSLPRRIALYTETLAENLGERVSAAVATLSFSSDAQGQGPAFDKSAFFSAVVSLALVVGTTVALYLLLRMAAGPLFARAGEWVQTNEANAAGFLRRVSAIVGSLLLDIVVILLACAAGYAIAMFAFGESGSIGTRESLFINAFAMIEVFKALIRAVFAARYDGLRPFPSMSAEVAAWWSVRLRWLTGSIGYALLLIVPIINKQISFNVGAMVSLAIMTAAYLYAIRLILGNRKVLTARIIESADKASMTFFSVLLRILARTWVLIALGYVTVLFAVSQLYPDQALPYMMSATGQTLLAMAGGLLLSALLTHVIGRRIHMPERLTSLMPKLEDRVNAFVPATLKLVRLVLLVVVVVLVFNAWDVFNLVDWIRSEAGAATLAMLIRVGIVLLTAMLFWTVSASIIEARMNTGEASSRKATLLTLFQNVLAIIISTITFMVVLSQIGVDIGPLIAGAGVLGLAVGFGAQKMVQDVITGVFIQIENAMNVGDVVTVAGVSGTAERLSIRSVAIRDLSGTFHIVPFSSVGTVSNYMRDFAVHKGEYGIAYREDIDHATEKLREAFEELKQDATHGPNIIEDINVAGVVALGDNAVTIRVLIKTRPGSQWAVGRAYNRLVKIHFDRAGIEIPFPHRTLYFGEDRDGQAAPAHLRMLGHDSDDAPATPSSAGGRSGQSGKPSLPDNGEVGRED